MVKILKIFWKIPLIIELVITGFIYFIIYVRINYVLSESARESFCQNTDLASDIMCWYYTDPLVSLISTFLILLVIVEGIKKKVFN